MRVPIILRFVAVRIASAQAQQRNVEHLALRCVVATKNMCGIYKQARVLHWRQTVWFESEHSEHKLMTFTSFCHCIAPQCVKCRAIVLCHIWEPFGQIQLCHYVINAWMLHTTWQKSKCVRHLFHLKWKTATVMQIRCDTALGGFAHICWIENIIIVTNIWSRRDTCIFKMYANPLYTYSLNIWRRVVIDVCL